MGKKTDKLYITHGEHSGFFGQHSAGSVGNKAALSSAHDGMQALPFDCCALTLAPWTNPVCTREEGTIFELTHVIPYLNKYGTNPATGQAMQIKDLVKLNFHKNENGKYHDPVSFKEFNEHTHLVAVSTTGNVFSWDTVHSLNIKAKHMVDLISDEPFRKSDLITLQDPHGMGEASVSGASKPHKRNLAEMHHVKHGHVVPQASDTLQEINTSAAGGASKLLDRVRASQPSTSASSIAAGAPPADANTGTAKKVVPYNATSASTGMTAASFTSSGLTPVTKSERQTINEEEFMLEKVAAGEGLGAAWNKGKKKASPRAFVRVTTNFGPINVELYCDKAPKTCYNFLTLVKRGYYDDTVFHRLIPGFMVQGGDPTGTGRGGASMWDRPFRDELDLPGALRHDSRGSLSMANKGPATNGSQFFFTFRDQIPSLDHKHTVFGKMLPGEPTLDNIERVPTEKGTDRPLRSVRIFEIRCLDDPFEAYKAELARQQSRDSVEEVAKREEKRKRREEDRTTWLGTNLGEKRQRRAPGEASELKVMGTASGVGKYMKATTSVQKDGVDQQGEPIGESFAKRKTKTTASDGGFGDFSGW
ncbi:Cyclophilin type, U box-containing peptidyl-prolyl cis-trans isomerase [Ceraceosorus bombacis]|uniref:RING-type E3 ubiquitin transferase n=1 Tax=Ceraceosorus bombacis TaxID=401625 RepID=A0A0N7LB85_9BASI|nr:Cyclophilin type, U box-containing peptidyl-prolyl cis-trans isomerase [Ceraceosorus bombacis]